MHILTGTAYSLYWVYLDVSDRFTDLRFEVWRLKFSLFCLFPKIQLDYHCFLSFISYPLVASLHLESSENNLFKIDFSIFLIMFFTVKPSQEGEFFVGL